MAEDAGNMGPDAGGRASGGSHDYGAFVSYASADKERAFEIAESLEARGMRCWIAPRDVRAGKEYPEEIIRGIERSKCLVLVLSDAANASVFVRREVERAVSYNKPVFPVRIEEVLPSPSLELLVSATHWVDAWTGNMVDHIDKLARDLDDKGDGSPLGPLKPLSPTDKVLRFAQKNLTAVVAIAAIFVVGLALLFSRGPSGYDEQDFAEMMQGPPLTDLRKEDLRIQTNVPRGGSGTFSIMFMPRNGLYLTSAQGADILVKLDDGPFESIGTWSISKSTRNSALPETMTVKIVTAEGKTVGPFTYALDLREKAKQSARTLSSSRDLRMRCNPNSWGGPYLCSLQNQAAAAALADSVELLNGEGKVFATLNLKDPGKSENAAYSERGNYSRSPAYLVPISSASASYRFRFDDGTTSDTGDITVQQNRNVSPLYALKGSKKDAPPFYAVLTTGTRQLYETGGSWSLYPLVGDEVESVSWTLFEGGRNDFDKQSGFFNAIQKPGADLGVRTALNGGDTQALQVTYRYAGGGEKTYRYSGDWQTWVDAAAMASIDYDRLFRCQKSGIIQFDLPEGQKAVDCYFDPPFSPTRLISDIRWGLDPQNLKPLGDIDQKPFIDAYKAFQQRQIDDAKADGMTDRQISSLKTRQTNQMTNFERRLGRFMKPWQDAQNNTLVLSLLSRTDAVFFQVVYKTGETSRVVRESAG